METFKIDILNPKVKGLLKDLEDLDLIRIRKETSTDDFSQIVKKMRGRSKEVPSLDEITAEVEAVRRARYEK
jgi:hypothetical protein